MAESRDVPPRRAVVGGASSGLGAAIAEFAAVVGFLASPNASYVTASLLSCDGGMLRGMS